MRKLTRNDCLYALRELSKSRPSYYPDISTAYFTPRVIRDFLYEKSCYDRQGAEQKQMSEIEEILEDATEKKLIRKATTMVSISYEVRKGYKLTRRGIKLASEINLSERSLKELKQKTERHNFEERPKS